MASTMCSEARSNPAQHGAALIGCPVWYEQQERHDRQVLGQQDGEARPARALVMRRWLDSISMTIAVDDRARHEPMMTARPRSQCRTAQRCRAMTPHTG